MKRVPMILLACFLSFWTAKVAADCGPPVLRNNVFLSPRCSSDCEVVVGESAGPLQFTTDGEMPISARLRELRGTTEGQPAFIAHNEQPLTPGKTYELTDGPHILRTVTTSLSVGAPPVQITGLRADPWVIRENSTCNDTFPPPPPNPDPGPVVARWIDIFVTVDTTDLAPLSVDVWVLPEDAEAPGVPADPFEIPAVAPLAERLTSVGGPDSRTLRVSTMTLEELPEFQAGQRVRVAARVVRSDRTVSNVMLSQVVQFPSEGCSSAAPQAWGVLVLLMFAVRRRAC